MLAGREVAFGHPQAAPRRPECPPGGGLSVAPGTDTSLAIYSEGAFARLAERLAMFPPPGKTCGPLRDFFMLKHNGWSWTARAACGSRPSWPGWPAWKKMSFCWGVQDHLGSWAAVRWRSYVAEKQAHYDQIAETAFGPDQTSEQERRVRPFATRENGGHAGQWPPVGVALCRHCRAAKFLRVWE